MPDQLDFENKAQGDSGNQLWNRLSNWV